MEVHLNPEIEAKLSRVAAARGSNEELIAREAIERFIDYDEWFVQKVEAGIAEADRGELLSHEEVGLRLEDLIARKHVRA